MFRSSVFDKAFEKATSQLLLEPDLDSMLQVVDSVRQNDVTGKYVMRVIKKKLSADNSHVVLYTLGVLEVCVKNCGAVIHRELATKEFMEFLKEQSKRPEPINEKILELIQTWSHAFRNEPNYKAVEDIYSVLRLEGAQFPALEESDAMFMSENAPEWKHGDSCARCMAQFSIRQRKHHCRNCGEVVCQKCSSKTCIIPKFGIEQEVRVCDSCYNDLSKPVMKEESALPAEYLASPLSKQLQAPPSRSEQEIAEDVELKLALALSRTEAEGKEKERNYGARKGMGVASSAPVVLASVIPTVDTSDMDPELARYLNRNYWDSRLDEMVKATTTTTPSAPSASSAMQSVSDRNEAVHPTGHSDTLHSSEQTAAEKTQFLAALQSSVEIFTNRMHSNSQRGRPIANDTSVQSLFTVISSMHPQLMKLQQELEDGRSYYESLQDKLAQLRDAREALDSLREEHHEKRQREVEEMNRLRQMQMMQKLEVMRQKKHEYLEMQRQLALQRLQQQEHEMALRLEQQKQLTHMRQVQTYGYPQVYSSGQHLPVGGMASAVGMVREVPPHATAPPEMIPAYAGPSTQPMTAAQVYQIPGYVQQQQVNTEVPQPGLGNAQLPLQSGGYLDPNTSQIYYSQMPSRLSTVPGSYQAQNPAPHPPIGANVVPPGAQQPQRQHASVGATFNQGPGSLGHYGPSVSGMAQPSYTSVPPGMEYSSFDMRELAYNLTPAQQSLQPAGSPYADLSQQHFPQPAHIGQHQYAERPQPATEYPDANSGTLPDPHGRQQLAQSGMDAQLIMFD